MSHPNQLAFFELVAEANRSLLDGSSVLEVGSFDVNGSMRNLYSLASRYVGVDLTEGPGVDVIAFGHELTEPDGSFDLALSGECFEHDRYWPATVRNMARMTRAGGLVAFSCAGRGRLEHGTRRTDPAASPGTQAIGSDYYHNLTEREISEQVDLPALFSRWGFAYASDSCDLFFAGLRTGPSDSAPQAHMPDWSRVDALRSSRSWRMRSAALVMRPLSRVLPDEAYQNLMLPVRRAAHRVRPDRG